MGPPTLLRTSPAPSLPVLTTRNFFIDFSLPLLLHSGSLELSFPACLCGSLPFSFHERSDAQVGRMILGGGNKIKLDILFFFESPSLSRKLCVTFRTFCSLESWSLPFSIFSLCSKPWTSLFVKPMVVDLYVCSVPSKGADAGIIASPVVVEG